MMMTKVKMKKERTEEEFDLEIGEARKIRKVELIDQIFTRKLSLQESQSHLELALEVMMIKILSS